MQRYGQICIVCYNCETHCLFMTKCDLISHKCVQADFLTCVQTDFLTNAIQTADGAVGQFTQNTGLPFQGIQQTNMSGEQVSFLSYYFYN